jgi:hypothetical protein
MLADTTTPRCGFVRARAPECALARPNPCQIRAIRSGLVHGGGALQVRRMDWIPTRLNALSRPAGLLAGWHLSVWCRACRVMVRLEVAQLVKARPSARVADLVDRLRCSRCGAPPASVRLADGVTGQGQRQVHQVELLEA